jgi:hypothetical protein
MGIESTKDSNNANTQQVDRSPECTELNIMEVNVNVRIYNGSQIVKPFSFIHTADLHLDE